MYRLFLLTALFIGEAFGGSLCPAREDIYPCSCVHVPKGKNIYHTIINCHRLADSDSLAAIFPRLRSLNIDEFYLYDSFWEANKLEVGQRDKKQTLPSDWITLLKIKEIEIVDTGLSPCFACQSRLNCRNTVTTRFTVINSTTSEKICNLCDSGRGNKYAWTGCMSKLKEFRFTHGKIQALKADFFPTTMKELRILNLTHNDIAKIEPGALKELPRLISLDLSHNAMQSLDNIFNKESILEFLDVSNNMLKSLGTELFPFVPYLKTLKADNNMIVELKESDWKSVPEKLRNIDLRENPLHCDCSIIWVNQTFHINVVIVGHCASPEEYENSLLRRASRLLATRCDEEGNIGTRSTKKKQPATTPSF